MNNQRNTFLGLSDEVRAEIKVIAKAERRTPKAQTELLVDEALANRRQQKA